MVHEQIGQQVRAVLPYADFLVRGDPRARGRAPMVCWDYAAFRS